jgi:glycosyltransferase involved in cell wall biosynthesis
VELFHFDVPYFDQRWQSVRGLLNPQAEAAIAGIPSPSPGQKFDAVLRIAYPYNLSPSVASDNVVTFGTAEMGCVPLDYTRSGQPLRSEMAVNPNLRIVTPSNWSRRGFISSGAPAERVFLVPHGVDPAIFHPMDPAQRAALRQQLGWNGFVFLSVGAMTQNKGLVPLLRTFAAIASQYPQAMLVMKGMDALYASGQLLLANARELTEEERQIIQPRLHYRGETLSFQHVAVMYQLADAYVSPYSAEGFNMPVLEAAACGCPIICTAGGSTDDFTREDFALRIDSRIRIGQVSDVEGRLLDPQPDSLMRCMVQVMQDSLFRARAQDAGPAFVQARFTWERVVDQLVRVLFGAD